MRNNYTIKDASMWLDYLNLLEYFKKDILNAKYFSPNNLKREHDLLMNKKSIKIEQEKLRKEQHENKEMQIRLEHLQKIFSNTIFCDDLLQIQVLTSIEQFKQEGQTLRHCVYTNQYYLKSDSLILSASDKQGKKLETVEISIKTMKIIQSRGICNQNSEYHNNIVHLVNKNIPKIKKLLTRKIA